MPRNKNLPALLRVHLQNGKYYSLEELSEKFECSHADVSRALSVLWASDDIQHTEDLCMSKEIEIKIGSCGERLIIHTYPNGTGTIELVEEDDTYCQRVSVSKAMLRKLQSLQE